MVTGAVLLAAAGKEAVGLVSDIGGAMGHGGGQRVPWADPIGAMG